MTQLKWCFSRIHSKVFVPKILKSTFIWKLDKNEQIWGRRWLTSFISRKPRRKGRETRGYCWPRFVTVRHERWEDERTRCFLRDEARTKQISKTRYQGFHLLLDAHAPLKRYSSTVRPFTWVLDFSVLWITCSFGIIFFIENIWYCVLACCVGI